MLMSSDGPWHDDRGVVDHRPQAALPGLVSDLCGGRRDAAHRTPVLPPSMVLTSDAAAPGLKRTPRLRRLGVRLNPAANLTVSFYV